MNMNGFFTAQSARCRLDPRTKIVMLLVVNIVVICGGLSGASAYIRPALSCLPFILLLSERKIKTAVMYFIFVCPAILLDLFFVTSTNGALNILMLIYSGIMARFVPGLMMGYYLMSTTKISELIAAMERMHMPQSITIPFAVMIRFFPTVGEENSAIGDAMRMRGVRMCGGNAVAMLEYRFVPMMISTVKIGEELSAAALTRGLGAPVKRTNICRIGLRASDWILIIIAAVLFALWILF